MLTPQLTNLVINDVLKSRACAEFLAKTTDSQLRAMSLPQAINEVHNRMLHELQSAQEPTRYIQHVEVEPGYFEAEEVWDYPLFDIMLESYSIYETTRRICMFAIRILPPVAEPLFPTDADDDFNLPF